MSRFPVQPAPLALAVALAIGAASAHAQAPAAPAALAAVEINIGAQPLAQALNALAHQTRLELIVQPALVEGKTAPAVTGRLTPREALDKLLSGSGLAAGIDGSVVTVRRAPQMSTGDGNTLAAVTVTAQAVRSPTTEQTGSYTARALTIGKMEQSIRETPQSVTVVTRQQMDDQNLVTLEDVIEQSTGFTKSQRNFGAHVYTLRGYVIPDGNYLIDGVSGTIYNVTGWVPMDTAIFDRVEVLRGAGGLLVGQGDPSGVVNMVRKRPRQEKHFDVAASIGSWSNYRTEFDAGGPLNAEGTVRGRVVMAYQDRKYFYDVQRSKEPLFYGVIDADLSSRTKLTAGLRHQENDIDGYTVFGLPRFTNGLSINAPRSSWYAQNWNNLTAKTDEVFVELDHRFNDDWRGKVTVNQSETSVIQKLGYARGAINPTSLAGLSLTGLYFTDLQIKSSGLDANVTGKFKALGGNHQAMFGINVSHQESDAQSTTLSRNIAADAYNFNHALVPEPTTPAYANRFLTTPDSLGIYGSTRWQLAEPLHLSLGGRLSWYRFSQRNMITGAYLSDYKQDAEFTPYAGLVYDLSKQWSVYASYADTFTPQSQYSTASGALLKPAIGANYEAGVKGELMDGKLNLALAVFNIKKTDIAVIDQNALGACPGITTNDCYRNQSLQRSRGFDVEAAGLVAPGWEVSAGYTFQRSKDEAGDTISYETPRHMVRASTSYRLPGDFSRWTVGGSLSAQSRFHNHPTSAVQITEPGRAVLDLRVAYRIDDHWTASLNLGNVFDKTYYSLAGGITNGGYYGTPRNATLIVRGSFY